jgi:hypothetical protein
MADNDLLYLIEGAQQPSRLRVFFIFGNEPVKVTELRQAIFDNNIQYLDKLAPVSRCLTLLKVVAPVFHFRCGTD